MTEVKVAAVLDELIRTCRESEACFSGWADKISKDELQILLSYRARMCRRNASELSMAREAVGDCHCSGPQLTSSWYSRRWSELRRMMRANGGDNSVLSACEAQDSRSLVLYRDALENDLPASVHKLVAQQFAQLIDQHARLQRLRLRAEKKEQRLAAMGAQAQNA